MPLKYLRAKLIDLDMLLSMLLSMRICMRACIVLLGVASLCANAAIKTNHQEVAASCRFQSLADSPIPDLHVGYFLLPPYSVHGKDGTALGSWPQYIKVLLDRSGLRYSDAIYPAKRLASKLFSGEVDLTIVADNILLTAGEEKITHLPQPLVTLTSGLVSLKANPINSIDAVRGEILGVNRGYSYGGLIHDLMKPELQLELWPAESEVHLMKRLMGRRMKAAIMYDAIFRHPQPDWNIDTNRLHFAPLKSNALFVTLSKNNQKVQAIQRVLTHNMTLIDQDANLLPCAAGKI